MRILFSGYHNPHFATLTEYVERAIEKCVGPPIVFDDRTFLIPGRIRKGVPFLQQLDLKRMNHKLWCLAKQNNPDLCLVTGGHRILPEIVDKIRTLGIRTVLWTVDAPIDFDPIIRAASHYDFVFCGGSEAVEILKGHGIQSTWLPFACDPEVHQPLHLTDAEIKTYGSDVAFVGSFYPNRAELLEQLTDFDLLVWGPGWERLPSTSCLRQHTRTMRLTPHEWMKIYSASKIMIVVHYQDGRVLCYQASPKVYETLACGGFMMVDDQKDMRALFDDGKQVVFYKNAEHLKERIGYFLSHPEERRQIAVQGQKEILAKHAYRHRIEQMLTVVTNESKDR